MGDGNPGQFYFSILNRAVANDVSPDWSPAGSACYFFIIIVIRHETTAAARWALLLFVRTLFNNAITVALWTGFHLCLPGYHRQSRRRGIAAPAGMF
jgi:hypothetical protein